jgi:hypothetical protein
MNPPTHLLGLNGHGAGCREELEMFAGDDAEKPPMLCDAFLMGVAEPGLRQVRVEIAGLDCPKRPAA